MINDKNDKIKMTKFWEKKMQKRKPKKVSIKIKDF